MNTKKTYLTLSLLLLFTAQLPAQTPFRDFDSLYRNDSAFAGKFQTDYDGFDIFDNDKILHLTIVSDFKNLIKKKYKNQYQPAQLHCRLNDTLQITRQIRIKPRGNMRKNICYMPPLKINFDKKQALLKQLQQFDKMKMVVDCKRGKTYQQYLLSEYYAYKMYNIITNYSFRVRLLKVTYQDTSGKLKPASSFAFVIESIDQFAHRLNAVPLPTARIADRKTDLNTLSDLYLFQYLIGNTDWSIAALHNIKTIKSKKPLVHTPCAIPYDFDYAGIVNTNYAVPHESLGIDNVRQRLYRGVCIPEVHIHSAVRKFIDAKALIYELYTRSPLLHERNKRLTLDYINKFYNTIENKYSLKRNIIETCR